MQLIVKYAAPPDADRFKPVTAEEVRAILAETLACQDFPYAFEGGGKASDIEYAEAALAAAVRGEQVLHAMDEDGDYFAIAEKTIVLRDCGTKQIHKSEASARRAIRDWFLSYDFGDLKAPSKAAIRRAWSRVRGERDLESLASEMTSEVWSMIGRPADWCSYCAIQVER